MEIAGFGFYSFFYCMFPCFFFVLDPLPLFASLLFDAFAIGHRLMPLLLTMCLLLHLDISFISASFIIYQTPLRIQRCVSVVSRTKFRHFFFPFPHFPLSLHSVYCHPHLDSMYKYPSPALAKARQLWPPLSLHLILRLILCVFMTLT